MFHHTLSNFRVSGLKSLKATSLDSVLSVITIWLLFRARAPQCPSVYTSAFSYASQDRPTDDDRARFGFKPKMSQKSQKARLSSPSNSAMQATPPKINIEPENDGLEDDFPFPGVYSQVPC